MREHPLTCVNRFERVRKMPTGTPSDETGDVSQVEPLLDQIGGPIGQFTADGAYDGRPIYDTVINHSAAAAIVIRRVPTRSNQSTTDLLAKGTVISPQSAETAG